MSTTTYTRTYSYFDPTRTYDVADYDGRSIGAVARQDDGGRWTASNRTWGGGGQLAATFPTRGDAALALRHIRDGIDPAIYGGYVDRHACRACRVVLIRDVGTTYTRTAGEGRVYDHVGPWTSTTGEATCREAGGGPHDAETY